MSDNTLVESDDLDAFSKAFFSTGKDEVKEPIEAATEEDTSEDLDDASSEALDTDPVAESDEDSDEADTESDEQDDDPEDEPEEKPKKNRKSAQERIDELTAARKEAERRADADRTAYQTKLAEMEAKLNSLSEKKEQPVGTLPTGAPDPNAEKDGNAIYPLGEFDPAYIRDLTRFTIDQEQSAAKEQRDQQEAAAAAQRARDEATKQWTDKLESAEAEYPDVREKINSLEGMFTGLDANYGQYLVDVVMSLDNGPAVLRYLADAPKEAREIVNSGPASATIRLGRLDAIVQKKTKAEEPPKKVTKAAPPPSKVTRGTGVKSKVTGDTDDLDAFTREFFR